MIREEAMDFLKGYPPFRFLEEADLLKVVAHLKMEFYPRDTTILREGGQPSAALHIIKQGAVKVSVHPPGGEERVIDYRGEGETFGFLSLIGKDRQDTTVAAIEDTVCYLLPKAEVLRLLEQGTVFTEYFLKSHFSKYIHRTYSEMRSRSLAHCGSDAALFTTAVRELATRDVATAPAGIAIREAASIMASRGISSLVIEDGAGVPVGIVTDRDLREKVVARGRSAEDPVGDIMSTTLIKVDARDLCFEALLKMIGYGVHHLIVVDAGRVVGVVTNHDFMMLQGTSPLALVREVENQWTVEGLVPVAGKVTGLIGVLLKEGARASNITRILTEINDRVERRIVDIAVRACGPPPVPFTWIVYGSQGRAEQTFRTDQDNAIVYRDPATPAEAAEAEEYFARLSESVVGALARCGFERCPGGYMATNAIWRKPLSVWKGYFSEWIHTPTPEAVLFSVILFDFRPLWGETALAEELRDHLTRRLRNQGLFLKFMADMAVRVRPPLGFLRTFVVEKSGEHKDQLNLKHKCLAPLVNIARLFALESGIAETSTLGRIEALAASHPTVREYGEELAHAFEFAMLLRLHHQFDRMASGARPDNFVNPDALSNLEKKTLKEACQLISRVQDVIARHYNPGMAL